MTVPGSSVDCNLTLFGFTGALGVKKSHAGSITSASTHTGGCPLHFRGLPWNIILTSKSGGYIENLSYDIFGIICAPENINVAVNKRGVWDISGGADSCNWTGSLKSTPEITIGR